MNKEVLIFVFIFMILHTTTSVFSQDANVSMSSAKITNFNIINALFIDQNNNTSASTSVGGALRLDNTDNTGAGLIIYSNMGVNANGRLLNIRADNTEFDQAALNINYVGKSDAFTIVHKSNAYGSSAVDISSINENYTSVGISGREKDHGTLKVTHNKPFEVDDSDAAAISINIAGIGTAAQGLYIYSDGNTSGNLISLNNGGKRVFSVNSFGKVSIDNDLLFTADPYSFIRNLKGIHTVSNTPFLFDIVGIGSYMFRDSYDNNIMEISLRKVHFYNATEVRVGGDLMIESNSIFLTSPNGTEFKCGVNNNGSVICR
jgi:hypothetical protein